MKSVIKVENKGKESQSKTYIKYQKLLTAIEDQQRLKINLQEGLQKAHSKIKAELSPLHNERDLLLRDYLIRLDELAGEIGIGKYNREWLENYMVEETEALLDIFGHQDKILSVLYTKYSSVSLDDIAKDDDMVAMAESFSRLFGFEVDVKELLEKGETAYYEAHRDQILQNIGKNKQQFDDSETVTDTKRTEKKRSGNIKLKEEEEDSVLAKDARSVYMRLIKNFHPDLEKDPAIRDEKNELIKQVTKAYQENDFFNLLKLQITYLDDNEADAVMAADDMLKRYNKILQKQLNELQAWIDDTHFSGGAIVADFIDKNGKFSPQKFAAQRRAVEKESLMLKTTLADSKKRPKGWFKEQISSIRDAVQQSMMQNMFADVFGDMGF